MILSFITSFISITITMVNKSNREKQIIESYNYGYNKGFKESSDTCISLIVNFKQEIIDGKK